MTRIIATGNIKPRIKKIYDIVRKAQAIAIEAIKPGVKAAKIDSIARQYIRSKGFGKYFGHALGHGVGMEVHEKPTISGLSEGTLQSGMVFTVEPAVACVPPRHNAPDVFTKHRIGSLIPEEGCRKVHECAMSF